MHYTIYKTTNIINGKYYIGKHQTENLDDGYLGSGKHFRRSVAKHGIESFKKEILHVFETEAEMNAKEAELVTEEVCSNPNTYNICVGGKGGWSYVNRQSDRQKWSSAGGKKSIANGSLQKALEKLSELRKNSLWVKSLSEKTKLGQKRSGFDFGKIWLGKKHSDQTKIKIGLANSLSNLGAKNSQYGTKWITNGIDNKKIKPAIDIIPEGWYYGRVNSKY